ncbi:Gnk2-homologous domain, partial [Sesbania bispinosa]
MSAWFVIPTLLSSPLSTRPAVYLLNTANISNQASFMPLLADAMNKTADEAASGGDRLYATNQTNLSGFQTLYTLTQCTPDLSPEDCRICLRQAIGDLPYCCEGKQGGRVLFPSCNISCSTATTTNSAFQLNLRNLLSNLSSNATNGKDFLMTDASEIVLASSCAVLTFLLCFVERGRVLYPSCNMRFELFQFYDLQPPEAATPPT